MKAVYDKHTDTMTLRLSAAEVSESDGALVSIEILNASRHVTQPEAFEFRVST
jgi:uncharacterized protein YuzE